MATVSQSFGVHLAFGREGLPIDLPAGFDYQVLDTASTAAVADPRSTIEKALATPISGPSLAQLCEGKKSAAISVCDITRPAPNPTVLPPLLWTLLDAGIPLEGIRILIATGLHRPATDAEIAQIAGPEVYGKFEILNHHAREESEQRNIGSTRSGTPVWIDERFMSADLHITLGFIEPHLMLGFSGGRKLIAPGLAGEATIKQLHSPRFMRDRRTREASVDDNPLHAELLEIAAMARHDFIVDVSLTRDRKIAAVFAGESVAAHAAGMKWVSQAHMQTLEQPADAVITTSAGYPLDLTFYQTVKGITAASHLVKEGGKILLFGACQEGAGAREFREMLLRYPSGVEFLDAIDHAPVTVDQWQLEKLAMATETSEVLYCVPGLPAEYLPGLWGTGYHRPEEALRDFFIGIPQGSRILVIPEGPYVLAQVRHSH